jgi:hypothetical protein
MRTQLHKNKSDSGNGALKNTTGKFTPRRTAKKDSESVVYSRKEALKILNDFFTQPNYFDE